MVTLQTMMTGFGRLVPKSIASRLYSLAVLTIGSLLMLVTVAMLYVAGTAAVVTEIRDRDLMLSLASADVELLLERHRRIVESAPVQFDRLAIDRDRRSSEAISDQISDLLQRTASPELASAQKYLGDLVHSARRVLYLAANFAQAEAVKEVDTYTRSADSLQAIVRNFRTTAVAATERRVGEVLASGQKLQFLIYLAGLITFFVVLPLSAFIIRNVISRIKDITETMRRIAANDRSAKINSTRAADEIGEMARALAVFKQNAETVLSNSQEIEKLNIWFHIALNNMARGLSMYDADGYLLVCNSRYLELYNLPPELGLPGTSLDEIADHWCAAAFDVTGATRAAFPEWRERLVEKLKDGLAFTETHELPDGRMIMVNTQPLEGGGWVDLHEDITEKRAIETRIARLAQVDALTNLANRHHFQETLARKLARVDSDGGFALIWFDLDKFKAVNDTLGHPAGDELLRIVAERIRATVRSGDFIARLGGDEFAVIATVSGKATSAAVGLANRLIRTLSTPYDVSGKMVSVGASIGIAMAPEHGRDPELLVHNADVALYRAKTRGRGQCFVFNDHLEQEISEREREEADLRRALASNEFLLHYQPIIDLKTGRVQVCEALMRWKHPQRGMISPGVFIPLAEETGLIGAMGEWALRQACQDAMRWPEHVKVSVNVAATQFTSTDVVVAVKTALEKSGLAARRLQLEVTETVMLKDTASTLQALEALRDMGVSIALDDFGTGYASLSYLRSFPFDKIKIDQCFVRDIGERHDCFAIVRTIVELARSLGMQSVAEGIETQEVLDLVTRARCDEAQGYFFSRPVSVEDLDAALAAAETKTALAA